MAESFAELFEESQVEAKMRPGSIVLGTIVEVRSDFVVVNAGLKSEGIIPIDQFRNNEGVVDVNVGDEIDVALEAVEDGYGETKLSREKAKRAKAWEELELACEETATVTGVITDKVKGGFTVDISTIRAFLPGSLVDVRPVRDTSYLEGKPLEFKVIKVDRRRNNVVVSRRAVVENENSAEREALLDGLTEGTVIKGLVKNLTAYGAFIDLGGIDRLLHSTDMSWRRVKHPSEVVIRGSISRVAIRNFPDCSARFPTSPTTAVLLKSKKVLKASFTFRKWTGRTRTCIPQKSSIWAKKSRSWFLISTRSVGVFHSA